MAAALCTRVHILSLRYLPCLTVRHFDRHLPREYHAHLPGPHQGQLSVPHRSFSTQYTQYNSSRESRLVTKELEDDQNVESDSVEGSEGEEESDLLIPAEIKWKFFKQKLNKEQKIRYLRFKDDVHNLKNDGSAADMRSRFHLYMAENPKSHYISSQVIKLMSTKFALEGKVEWCDELVKLCWKLGRDQYGRQRHEADLLALIVNNYLLSLTTSQDRETAVKLALQFLDKAKKRPDSVHPIVKRTLGNVLRILGLFEEIDASLAESSVTPLTLQALLDSLDKRLHAGKREEAGIMMEQHLATSSSGERIIGTDDYAMLAKVVSGLYNAPAYKQIAQFCSCTQGSLKNFNHIPVPMAKFSSLCKNYELVLHIASERGNDKLIRIVGGRNGLCRQLEYASSQEYVMMVQYIAQLCSEYGIGMDRPFWNYLFTNFFYSSMIPCDYGEFRSLSQCLRVYPLTTALWCRIITSTKLHQLPDIYSDLRHVGMMDDHIYTSLVNRTRDTDLLSTELAELGEFCSFSTEDKIS